MSDMDDRERLAVLIHRYDAERCGYVPIEGSWSPWAERLADALLAAGVTMPESACESGYMWQIPNHVEDMTQAQRELLGMMTDLMTDPARKIADSTRRDHLGPCTYLETFVGD